MLYISIILSRHATSQDTAHYQRLCVYYANIQVYTIHQYISISVYQYIPRFAWTLRHAASQDTAHYLCLAMFSKCILNISILMIYKFTIYQYTDLYVSVSIRVNWLRIYMPGVSENSRIYMYICILYALYLSILNWSTLLWILYHCQQPPTVNRAKHGKQRHSVLLLSLIHISEPTRPY